ncbi:rifin [Plasmodium falciparum IGH-CR14]|uniref:Rifin n=1 Tax=Plasmodium falciparum IGH-CR14 TaxID=580059 RepID=A0A0L1I6U2_PLAFA|nr:rifin [Plasmodium falciparum IGH-CR14]
MVYNQRNHYLTSTPKTSTRTLCECELYSPANYDNDPEMKTVMQDFDRQTSQRFEEYNERMIKNRQKYKEQCDKDIQKIILKDTIEKELKQQLITLETNIDTNDIPACVCEKSVADKVEKTCLKCGGVLGGGVAPAWGLISGLGYAAWINYAATTLVKIATDEGISEGVKVGLANVAKIASELLGSTYKIPKLKVGEIITAGKLTDDVTLSGVLKAMNTFMSGKFDEGPYAGFSTWVEGVTKSANLITARYPTEVLQVTKAVVDTKTGILTKAGNVTSSLTTAITASIIAIVVIVFVMVIIYLILRYRRKTKMKKKLQYIKLLKE